MLTVVNVVSVVNDNRCFTSALYNLSLKAKLPLIKKIIQIKQ